MRSRGPASWRRDDGLNEHRLYLVPDPAGLRLETSTIRQPSLWDWPALERVLSEGGFADLRTETVAAGDRTVVVNVTVA